MTNQVRYGAEMTAGSFGVSVLNLFPITVLTAFYSRETYGMGLVL